MKRRSREITSHDEPVGLAGWLYTDLLLGLAIVFLGCITFVKAVSGEPEPEPEPIVEVAATSTTANTTSTTSTTTTSTTTTTTSTTTTTTTTKPPIVTTTIPRGVEKGYYCLRLNQALTTGDITSNPDYINADETPLMSPTKPSDEWIDTAVKNLMDQLTEANLMMREAGITLVFGTSPSGDTTRGRRNAEYFIEFVIPKLRVFRDSATRAFWGGSPNSTLRPGKDGNGSATGKDIEGEVDNGFTLDFYLMTNSRREAQPATKKPDCG